MDKLLTAATLLILVSQAGADPADVLRRYESKLAKAQLITGTLTAEDGSRTGLKLARSDDAAFTTPPSLALPGIRGFFGSATRLPIEIESVWDTVDGKRVVRVELPTRRLTSWSPSEVVLWLDPDLALPVAARTTYTRTSRPSHTMHRYSDIEVFDSARAEAILETYLSKLAKATSVSANLHLQRSAEEKGEDVKFAFMKPNMYRVLGTTLHYYSDGERKWSFNPAINGLTEFRSRGTLWGFEPFFSSSNLLHENPRWTLFTNRPAVAVDLGYEVYEGKPIAVVLWLNPETAMPIAVRVDYMWFTTWEMHYYTDVKLNDPAVKPEHFKPPGL